ncbi:MAG TPA: M48 family metalloprotease, partial [Stellaceae bacterium]|nr:M48 family metalloprotease [Stellaceae bacterium]
DAEIENTIRAYATPLWKAAGLDASYVQIYLVNNGQINAFVAGGQRIFVYTGLLMRADRPNEVIGVLAHETGHIAGGHLMRFQDALESATVQSIIGFLLGTAGAVLSRNGEVAAAGALAGQSMAIRSLFAYSVGQEERADQAGLGFLDKTCQSARGLLQFFEILEKEEYLLPQQQDPYMVTHPFTQLRIEHVRDFVAHSKCSDATDPPELVEMHKRMLAKLRGFLNSPGDVLKAYPESDKSLYGRYARAAAYHRIPMDDKALAEMDSLLKEKPEDPYFNELKGQILFEGGHVAEAVPWYRKSVKELPTAPLLRVELAQAELESTEDHAMIAEAVSMLKDAVRDDDSNADAWHTLGIAQGKLGNLGEADLALAEEDLLMGDIKLAVTHARRAAEALPRGSPGWIRADDISREAKTGERDPT